MEGKRFGNLTVVKAADMTDTRWLCTCDCGNSRVVHTDTLLSNDILICGVHCTLYRKLYYIWNTMRLRCNSRNNRDYHKVGALGIKYHPDWHYFDKFAAWAKTNGYAEGLCLIRLDEHADFTPDNCEWVTRSEMLSRTNKGRVHKPHTKSRKLTADDVRFIRRWTNDPDVEMAARFRVCVNTIRNIRNYKTWKGI